MSTNVELPRLPYSVTWPNPGHSLNHRAAVQTADEAYRLAGAIADRERVIARVHLPTDGIYMQLDIEVEPRG